ncbi:MAG: CoA transferase [Thaumarchaeota archaeon]|nr:CoA transferase [Nitrososphaerota archaeon]
MVSRLKLKSPLDYSAMGRRIEERKTVNAMVQAALGELATSQVLSLLGTDVPCARVSTLTDSHGDEELKARGVVRKVRSVARTLTIALPPLPHRMGAGMASTPELGAYDSKTLRRRRGKAS